MADIKVRQTPTHKSTDRAKRYAQIWEHANTWNMRYLAHLMSCMFAALLKNWGQDQITVKERPELGSSILVLDTLLLFRITIVQI